MHNLAYTNLFTKPILTGTSCLVGAIETTETRASKERLINLLVQTFATNCCKIAKNEKNNKHDMQIKRSSLLLINASKQNTNASKWEMEHDSCLDKWSSFMELMETIKYHINTINEHCPMLLFYPATTQQHFGCRRLP